MSEAQTVAIVRIGEQNGDCGAGEKTRRRPKNRDCPKRSEARAKTGLSLLLGFSTEFSFPRSPVGMHIGNRLRPRGLDTFLSLRVFPRTCNSRH